jgi:predicted nucleic acid-binding protein
MKKAGREMECLERLENLTGQLEDILVFLKLENLIDDNAIKKVRTSSNSPKEVREVLSQLKTDGKLQLLRYEWNVLPVENILITIITDRNQKEFSYNGG